jgi:hypothetical protein
MAIWTYVRNQDPKSKVIAVEVSGGLILRIGTYASLTNEQLAEINNSGVGAVLEEGIVPPATNAGEAQYSSASTVTPWSARTTYRENQLVVSPEGELLRALRTFESGSTYVF